MKNHSAKGADVVSIGGIGAITSFDECAMGIVAVFAERKIVHPLSSYHTIHELKDCQLAWPRRDFSYSPQVRASSACKISHLRIVRVLVAQTGGECH